jgi:hypothetical protein
MRGGAGLKQIALGRHQGLREACFAETPTPKGMNLLSNQKHRAFAVNPSEWKML